MIQETQEHKSYYNSDLITKEDDKYSILVKGTIPFKYFLFRENGVELEIEIKGGLLFSDKKLTEEEREYINKNYLN